MAVIEVTQAKAIQVTSINVEGRLMVNVRQMYKRKTDTEWKPGRNALSVEIESVEDVCAAIRKAARRPAEKFKVITRE